MQSIDNIELRDETKYPDDDVLKSILGESFPLYKKLLELFTKNELIYEWHYYHDGKAWLCKVQKKKKTIVWMSAWKGFMQAVLYFPEKHVDQIYKMDISKVIQKNFRSTKNVGKSKPCIFKIMDENILRDFEKVMIYKIGCK